MNFLKDKFEKNAIDKLESKFHDKSTIKNNETNDQDFIDTFFDAIAKYDETIDKDLTDYPADDN